MSRSQSPPAFVVAICLSLLLVSSTGCWDSFGGRSRPPASAIWLTADVPPPDPGTLARLRSLDVGELFVEVARLDGPGEQPLERMRLPDLPAATAMTMVVTGTWNGRGDPVGLAAAVAAEIRQLRFEAEALGLVPIGLHFDLIEIADLSGYATFLEEVAKDGDRSLFISCSVPRSWMARSGLEGVVHAADAVVAFLYGQRADEPEDAKAWDFVQVERDLERLEAMGEPYFLGLTTLGVARRLSRDGETTAATLEASLRDFLWDRRFKLKLGFSLEGVNRMVYSVEAERPATVAGWKLKSRESVRMVRPATAHLEELTRLRGAWQLPHLLGTVYYRMPGPEELLSLRPANIIAALEPTPATPELLLSASIQRATGRGYLFRFAVENPSAEMTELSVLDNNVVQIEVASGAFGRVEVGDFERFALFERRDGELAPTFRSAKIIQLHLPILESEQAARTGDVEILAQGEPTLRLEGWFILPDGRTLDIGPYRWRNGQLTALSDGE